MEPEQIWELMQGHLLQGLMAVVVIPFFSWLIGRSKRDEHLREEQELRHRMELSRGLFELAAQESDPAARQELETMRTRVHGEFLDRARAQFANAGPSGGVSRPVDKKYWVVPKPYGFFGWIWVILAVTNLVVFAVIMLALAFSLPDLFSSTPADGAEFAGQIVGLILVVLIFALPTLLFRWFAFISARMGARSKARRLERQAQSQMAAA